MQESASRIAKLREHLVKQGLSAWISITSDPHASEYVPGRWAERAWLSGFTGSYGILVVTASEALLWTDSRYWVQASRQLEGSGIALMKLGAPDVRGWIEWLAENLASGSSAGISGESLPLELETRLREALSPRGISLRTDLDLAAEIWTDRPALPHSRIYENTLAPEPAGRKLERLRGELAEKGADAFATSALDEIGWLTNLRGSDVDYNPVFLSHLLVLKDRAFVFLNEDSLPAELRPKLEAEGFCVRPYDAFRDSLRALPALRLFIDPSVISSTAAGAIGRQVEIIRGMSPIALLKTHKTKEEIHLIEETMKKDGAALCRFYAWLEGELARGSGLTEMDVVRRLHEERTRESGYVSESFGTIAAVGPNAALPHYTPDEAHCSPLAGDTVLLIDSGAQYQSGTTDITRVTAIHRPPEALRKDYTAVLRAHLHLLNAYFPEGAYASQLDTFARAPLWETDADFGHGTGHGVGFFMNVHERPYSISPRSLPSEATRTVEGIVVSDEPGIYREGRWGIRIESLITPEVRSESEFGRFMGFRALTLCPIDTRLIVARMMKSEEIALLNRYHRQVREALQDRVEGEALDWLLKSTEWF